MNEEYLKQHPDLQEKIRAAGRENLKKIYARIAAERQDAAKSPKTAVARGPAKKAARATRAARPAPAAVRRGE